MKRFVMYAVIATAGILSACSSAKQSQGTKASRDNMKGTWKLIDVQTNLPEGFNVARVFDAAPYSDFQNSTWTLVRNGVGTYTLSDGTVQNIYWSASGRAGDGEFRFKRLMDGEKAANVADGYVLFLKELDRDHFVAVSDVALAEGRTGTITYTFSKQ